ncbi:hypothetical protein N7520_002891 [Penicillium odoratum]|uniref:uncharacterized protein n=1 Tax=Penicillium odoratum TaxID=1167516 RepID=UPI002549A5DA|nr:uncharacterized protein N7520_002891 [Penicillium odoratum]KAJ5772362.1 hypothetical protein N7520_002891 [Penicillium odoratum]
MLTAEGFGGGDLIIGNYPWDPLAATPTKIYSGFAVTSDASNAIYDEGFPDDHSLCYKTGDGRESTIEGDCWSTPRKFKWKSDFAGRPDTWEVKDGDLGTGQGQTDTTFIGIAIGEDASCVVRFDPESDGFPVDDDNGPCHVTSG